MACNTGFGSYSVKLNSSILFSFTPIYRIKILPFQFIFYPILLVPFEKDSSSQSASTENH